MLFLGSNQTIILFYASVSKTCDTKADCISSWIAGILKLISQRHVLTKFWMQLYFKDVDFEREIRTEL